MFRGIGRIKEGERRYRRGRRRIDMRNRYREKGKRGWNKGRIKLAKRIGEKEGR